MADIDDELLALAGGDSEDERSYGSVDSSSSTHIARGADRGTPPRRAKRRTDASASEEEGEASSTPSSPNSLESAPMEESDPDIEQPSREPEASGANDDGKYPVDGMFLSQAEKAEIMSLREVEREQIIADRISEIERQRQNRLLRQMVTSVENEEPKHVKKKRSAEAADLEDEEHSSSRQRTAKASETAMDSLRRARAEKLRRKEDQERRKDDFSPRHGTEEPKSDDDGFDRAVSRSPIRQSAQDVPAPEIRDFERARLGRNEFAQVCFTPGFESAITGCYIRISVGVHPETGIEKYRMAVIKGFSIGRPYALTGPNGPFITDQYVKAAHGKAVKEFPFIAASSRPFTESEINRYQITSQNEGVTLPTKQFLLNKIDDINGLINHKWTSEEIKARMAKRNNLKRRFDPNERERIAQLLDEAVAKGDRIRAEELHEELSKLSSQRLAFKTTLGPTASFESPKSSTEQDRLAARNRENRRMNAELVRKAQLKEKARTREMELSMKRGEQVRDDPSRRLRTKAKFVHDVNEKLQLPSQKGSASSTPAGGTPTLGATKPQLTLHLTKLQEKSFEDSKCLPTFHKPLMDDDVIGALDLDIDVEI